MRIQIAQLLVMATLIAAAARAEVALTIESKDGQTFYRLDNGRIAIAVAPAEGGAILSYKDRLGGNVELVPSKEPRGLCIDHFDAQNWPGEMYNARYEVVDQKNDPQAAALTLRYVTTAKNYDAKLKDVTLEKTYRLRADSPALECRVKITAPAKESRLLAYWQQNIFYPGGQYDAETDKSFRPSTRGVRIKDAGSHDGITGPEAFLSDFTAGWIALLDTQRRTGLVVLADYNELNLLYDCANYTAEPMFRLTFLPAGQSVEYITYLVPVAGLDNVVAATADYIAGCKMTSDGKGTGAIAFSVIRSVNAASSFSLKVEVRNVLKPAQAVPCGTVSFGAVSDQVQTRKLSFQGAGADPLVLQVDTETKEASGTTIAGKFEDYFNGGYKWGENMTVDMVTPVYRGERPKQKLTLLKPSPLNLKDVPGPQIWYAEGVLDNVYNVAPAVHMFALGGGGGQDKNDRVFTYASQAGMRLTSFPYDYDQLLAYDLLILGGVKNEALGNLGQEMFGDFVNAGGALIILGGPVAYGASGLRGTPLADLLPVTINPKPFDLVKLANGVIKPANQGAPFLEHLDWSANPRVMYLHQVEVKPWGKVVLEADGRPFLVIGEVGPKKARIACLLGAPMGTFAKNQTPFWEWADWTYLLRQLLWWEMKDDARFAADAW